MNRVTILGGGIVGLCTAYYLEKKGFDVTIIDQSSMTQGASYVNAGYITPSHIISLASPGMLRKGLRYMLQKESPFYIKPRWDLTFFEWAYHFYRSSTPEKVQKAIPVIKDINLLSKDLYDDMSKSRELGDFQWEKKGLLMLYKTQKEAESEFKVVQLARKEGLDVVELDRKRLLDLEPGVGDEVSGGFLYKCDAHTTPVEFMQHMKNYLSKRNVQIIPNEKVVDFEMNSTAVTKIIAENGVYETDELVIATGSWTGQLVKKMALKIPVQPGKGYSMNSSRNLGVNFPAVLMESKVAVTPMKGFTRFAGTMEFSGSNHIIRKERVQAIAKAVNSFYRNISLNDTEIAAAKCGLRPVSPDGLPYIGRLEKIPNVVIAAGHAMMGWSMGPATGKLVTEIICREQTSMEIGAFKPERFC
ncbi:NAD(P)/FAD-dependent oxidoreductase [Flavobacteriaceae bacterium M23B6Z8]